MPSNHILFCHNDILKVYYIFNKVCIFSNIDRLDTVTLCSKRRKYQCDMYLVEQGTCFQYSKDRQDGRLSS